MTWGGDDVTGGGGDLGMEAAVVNAMDAMEGGPGGTAGRSAGDLLADWLWSFGHGRPEAPLSEGMVQAFLRPAGGRAEGVFSALVAEGHAAPPALPTSDEEAV